nr:hypothetical protein [Chloroflexota bacterium]
MTEPTAALDLGRADGAPVSARRYLVIRNASAGSKGGISTNASSPEELDALLERHGIAAEVVETSDEGSA